MSVFSSLFDAATNQSDPDITACLALADYLDECHDERGRRLRMRTKRYERRLQVIREAGERLLAVEFITPDQQYWAFWHEREAFVSYLFRLLSTHPGERLPRQKVGGSYVLVEPN